MAKKRKNHHIGGEQLLLITPDSNWVAPTELPDLRNNITQIALDTENKDDGLSTGKGPGWAIGAGNVCGVSVAWRTDRVNSIYVPVRHPDSQCFDKAQVGRWLKDHMRSGIRFIFTNAVYDIGWTRQEWPDLPFEYPTDDTCCMAYMCNENRLSYSLDQMCRWRGIPGKNETVLREAAEAYGVDPKAELYKLPARYVGEYAEQDAASTLLLAEDLNLLLDKEDVRNAYQVEMDLVPMVYEMRRRGVRLDMDVVDRLYNKFKKQSRDALADLSDKLSMNVSIDELRQTSWLEKVFDAHRISYPVTKKTGQGSFEAKWMKNTDHWLPKLITRAKQREDAAEKFVNGYLRGFSHNGRLHASIHQYKSENLYDEDNYGGGTRTYRFSYSDPPLQQIPHRDEELSEIRAAFVAELGEEWLRADYSQQEYRLIVHFAEALELAKAVDAANRYREDPNTDFHNMVAEMTGLKRKPAKDCNFAKAYGAGVGKFAIMIGQSKEAAAKIMEQYDEKMPFVKQLFDYCQERAEDKGYIKLIDGAKIRFDWWEAYWNSWAERQAHAHEGDCSYEEAVRRTEDPTNDWFKRKLRRSRCNKAMNSLIQGNAARQAKHAMRDCWRAGRVPLLQVHDELCFSIANRSIGAEIGTIMRDTFALRVPMKVDLEYGPSWAG